MLQGGGVREDRVHQLIWRVFTKGNGLTLKAEAVAYLKERLDGPLSEAELLAAFSCIATEYRRGPGRPALVDQHRLASVIEGMLRMSVDGAQQPGHGHGCERVEDGRPVARTYVQAVNAAACPRWDYHVASRSFQHQHHRHQGHDLIGECRAKIEMYRRHFELVRQRVLRSEEFSGSNAVRVSRGVWSPHPPYSFASHPVVCLDKVDQGAATG